MTIDRVKISRLLSIVSVCFDMTDVIFVFFCQLDDMDFWLSSTDATPETNAVSKHIITIISVLN